VLSICSAGDNTLALLAQQPASVTAIDMSAAQLACLELRVAAFRLLSYDGMLALLGFKGTPKLRRRLYSRCRRQLSPDACAYWDRNIRLIRSGVCNGGKFESYFQLFRLAILPLVHSARTVDQLLRERDCESRHRFFTDHWNTPLWRAMFQLFFSRFCMGLLGRDASFFQYASPNLDLAQELQDNVRHALTELAPNENPYLNWILTGTYGDTLPFYLRRENFERIKANLHKLSWRRCSLEALLTEGRHVYDVFNLSDVFEYMSPVGYERVMQQILENSNSGSRLIYWNMVVPRTCPESLRKRLHGQPQLAQSLFRNNKTFFYNRLVIEDVI
jgi:S-adenosylmethionine-diacylglycerol 3-amino-3-carboxypropyl transferase